MPAETKLCSRLLGVKLCARDRRPNRSQPATAVNPVTEDGRLLSSSVPKTVPRVRRAAPSRYPGRALSHFFHSLRRPALAARAAALPRIVIWSYSDHPGALATLIGAMVLWPQHGQGADIPLPFQNAAGGAVTTEAGHVLSTSAGACGNPSPANAVLTPADFVVTAPRRRSAMSAALVAIDSRPTEGTNTLLEFGRWTRFSPPSPSATTSASSRQVDDVGAPSYAFFDFEGGWSLTALASVFAVVIVAVARWRGLRAMVGIGVAFGVLVVFLLRLCATARPRFRWPWWPRRRSSPRGHLSGP